MAAAVVVPALLSFDRELTSVAPKRTLPTWYKGDAAHKTRPSGHNADDTPGSKAEDSDADNIAEIRAGDYRLPLNAVFSPEQLVQYLVQECRAGRITWIKYIIFNKRIWSAATGWVTHVYNGSNPHDKHFHLSCKPDTASENNTKPVGLVAWVARLIGKPQGVKMIKLGDVTVPELRQGNRDEEGKTQRIKRIQAILNWLLPGLNPLTIDGDYGKATAAGVKEVMKTDPKRSSNNGSVFGEAEYRRFFAL
jgi:hypothetical protein